MRLLVLAVAVLGLSQSVSAARFVKAPGRSVQCDKSWKSMRVWVLAGGINTKVADPRINEYQAQDLKGQCDAALLQARQDGGTEVWINAGTAEVTPVNGFYTGTSGNRQAFSCEDGEVSEAGTVCNK